uniref:Magnetosome protein MamL n=1 Tax=Candidatus Magnetananas rongchengensis TaxID=1463558 RepID=A0A3S6IXV4_9BACT|nr:magnetosome protein MamL [Candidatus Magnetananas rongchenensis]
MFKTFTTITITVIVVLFAMQNFDHVPVYFFWGKSINIRLIFIIAISGVVGYLIRHFIGISREERLKRQLHQIIKKSRYARKRIDHDDI